MPGQWHLKWQEKVGSKDDNEWKYMVIPPTEKYLTKEITKTSRRCDVRLNYKTTLEVQHSSITQREVNNRALLWKELGKDIIWFIDGSNIDFKEWTGQHINGTKYLLNKIPNWVAYNFERYNYLLIDINDKIFKIQSAHIRFNMCICSSFVSADDLCLLFDKLKKDEITLNDFWNNWDSKNEKIGNIIRVQKGAGNGKTYEIWKSILEDENKTTFFLLTKVQSGVRVLFEELESQKERNEEHLKNMTCLRSYAVMKGSPKYIIEYENNITKKKIKIILGTIDSFCCTLCEFNVKTHDVFNELQRSINKNGITKINTKGEIKYAGERLKLNKETQIWIDEAQDLSLNYFDSFVKIILQTGCDIGFVGDKLQSLHYEENIFTLKTEDFKINQINFIDKKPTNINRRIKSQYLAKEINTIVHYNEYNCLPIENTEHDNLIEFETSDDVFQIFETPQIFGDDPEKSVKAKRIADIMLEKVDFLVKKYNALPVDFIFAFLIVSNNAIITELKSKLEDYWIKKFSDENYRKNIKNDYWKKYNHVELNKSVEYVQFHRSQNNEPINLTESLYKTRIVSVMTSKGMGRPFVFSCGIDERTLKICSNHTKGLMYESFLNVSLTRAEKIQFFQLTSNDDDIHNRFKKKGNVYYLPEFKTHIDISKIIQKANLKNLINMLQENDIDNDFVEEKTDNKHIIDYNHHCVRDSAWRICIILGIRYLSKGKKIKEKKSKVPQMDFIAKKIHDLDLEYLSPKKYYNYLNSFRGLENYDKEIEYLPIIKKSSKNCGKQYKNLELFIAKSVKKMKIDMHILYDRLKNPFHYILLDHFFSLYITKQYANPSINMVYTVADLLKDTKDSDEDKDANIKFYQALCGINNIVESFFNNICRDYGLFEWNIFHKIYFNGCENSEFTLRTKAIPIIGFNDNYIMHLVLKPTCSNINSWDVISDILMERFIITNPSNKNNLRKKNNFIRYNGKEIITYLFVLETGQIINFNNILNNLHEKQKKNIIEFIIETKKEEFSKKT